MHFLCDCWVQIKFILIKIILVIFMCSYNFAFNSFQYIREKLIEGFYYFYDWLQFFRCNLYFSFLSILSVNIGYFFNFLPYFLQFPLIFFQKGTVAIPLLSLIILFGVSLLVLTHPYGSSFWQQFSLLIHFLHILFFLSIDFKIPFVI